MKDREQFDLIKHVVAPVLGVLIAGLIIVGAARLVGCFL